MSEGRSDTESPVGPAEPLHGYVNVPSQQLNAENEDADKYDNEAPLLTRKERSRYDVS